MLSQHVGSANDAYEAVRRRLPDFGITRVADVTGLDWIGIPVWVAIRPLSKNLTVSQGKGLDHAAARASAIFESIELSVAEKVLERGDEPLTGRDLSTGTPVLVRRGHAAVNFARASTEPGEPPFNHSNGLASARSTDTAILQALLELAEREIRAEAHHNPALYTSLTRLETWSVFQQFPSLLSADVQVHLWSLTSRWDVPCVVARLWSEDFPMACLGAGAHVDPEVAAVRAITEAAQSRLTAISGGRDDAEVVPFGGGAGGGDYVDGAQKSTTFSTWVEENRVGIESDWILRSTATLVARCHQLLGVAPVVVQLHEEDDIAVVRVLAEGARFAGNVVVP